MSDKKRYNIKKILINAVWIMLGAGTVVLLVAAVNKKNNNQCKAVEIIIKGVKDNLFIDKNDVTRMLEKMNFGTLKGKPMTAFNLAGMETVLEKNKWIKKAELFFDNNDVLRINIMEREPIARIFNTEGNSFYIDSAITKLPLSDKFSARLPVFTNFPVTGNSLTKPDSNLLSEIKSIGIYILQSPFWMAQIEQVDITPERSFEMIPKIGNQLIVFGSADEYEEKFDNLFIFYKNVQSKVGWDKYSKLDVKFKNQVVAVKRDAAEIKLDSLKAIQLLKVLAANAQKQANDSSNIQLVQPKDDNSIPLAQQQDDNSFETQTSIDVNDTTSKKIPPTPAPGIAKPSLPADVVEGSENISKLQSLKNKSHSSEKPNPIFMKKTVTNPIIKTPVDAPTKQPKAIMQPKNDY